MKGGVTRTADRRGDARSADNSCLSLLQFLHPRRTRCTVSRRSRLAHVVKQLARPRRPRREPGRDDLIPVVGDKTEPFPRSADDQTWIESSWKKICGGMFPFKSGHEEIFLQKITPAPSKHVFKLFPLPSISLSASSSPPNCLEIPSCPTLPHCASESVSFFIFPLLKRADSSSFVNVTNLL